MCVNQNHDIPHRYSLYIPTSCLYIHILRNFGSKTTPKLKYVEPHKKYLSLLLSPYLVRVFQHHAEGIFFSFFIHVSILMPKTKIVKTYRSEWRVSVESRGRGRQCSGCEVSVGMVPGVD